MTTKEQPTKSSKFGKWMGGQWRKCVQVETQIFKWLAANGVPRNLVRCFQWIARLGAFLLISLLALGFLFIVAISLIATQLMKPREMKEDWAIGEQYDERTDPFYDPVNNSNSTDPRFHDD